MKINKKGVMIQTLVGWIIAITVLAVIVILAIVLKDELSGMAGFIKNLFRFGR